MDNVSKTDISAHPKTRISGLDGLRGVAVALVLGFHLYPRLVPGGWLGVSLFFTLSGFLITTVILRDLDNNSFTFKSFYARRARRLLPAALLVLALFTLSWTLLGWFDTNHRNDVFFAFLQIANWQQIWEGIPYGTALASPVVHYWSLAIEEQAYLVLPLLIVVFGAKRLRLVAPFLFILSVGATFLAHQNQSLIYFGTHTRAAEILAGVIVAIVMHNTSRTPKSHISTVVSATGLIYLITASTIVHLNDNIVYQGGLIITGVVSAAVIATVPFSPIATVLNLAPLVWLGTVSYGIYLIHWPVLLTLKQTDLPQWAISPLTLVATLGLAGFMHRGIEVPFRVRVSPYKILLLFLAIIVMTATVSLSAMKPVASFEEIEKQTSVQSSQAPRVNAPRIFFFGDSKSALLYKSLQNRLQLLVEQETEKETFSLSDSFTRLGCPIGARGFVLDRGRVQKVGEGCDWSRFDTSVQSSDIAIIWGGTWDTTDRKVEELFGNDWVNLKDDNYRAWVAKEYQKLFLHLRKRHQVKNIVIINYIGETLKNRQADYDDFIRSFEKDGVILLDLVEYLSKQGIHSFFPDGSHVSIGEPTEISPNNDNSGADLYEKWLEPLLCSKIKERTPEILRFSECPQIDYSPRVKN